MPSIPEFSTAGKPFPLCFALLFFLLFLLLSSSSVQGVSLREHRLRGSESEPQRANPHQAPNADMLKALEYIDSIRQRAGTGPKQPTALTPDYDAGHLDEMKKLRAMLRLASPVQSKGQAEQNEREEEEEGGEGNEEDKTQEWMQAVLSTLQQTEKASKPESLRPNAAHLSLGEGGRPAIEGKDGAYPWVQRHGVKPYKKHPLMFEDDEEGEGDEEDEKEQEGMALGHENPFKRTNENVEEKYTPQNLATLQSVFEELGRLANTKATQKRQAVDDDEEEDDEVEDDDDDEDDDDMFNVRNLAYEDVAGGLPDWAPLEEREEDDDKDERDNKHDQGLDYGNDGEEEDDDDMENDEGDDESYPVKRASNSNPREDPDDIANLVDYYLLKVLEKTEEEEQKRELEEEEEKKRVERRVAQSQYRNNIDPQAVYQLIQISQKFQIPPEDLMDMLRTGEIATQDKTPLRSQAPSRKSSELARIEDKLSQISSSKKHTSPEAQLYNRRLPDRQTSSTPEDRRTEEILNILGLGDVGNQDPAALRKPKQHKNSQSQMYPQSGGHSGESSPTQRRLPDKLKDDYDDTVDEDELAAYLAAQILAQYPNKNKVAQKRNKGGQATPGSFEQAIQDYFDQMDSDKSPPQKRRSETEGEGGATQTQRLDDEALMTTLLSYLNPETQESDDGDVDAKSVQGM